MEKTKLESKIKKLKSELKKTELVAVSKYFPAEDIEMAYKCGLYDFGENRVDELALKAAYFESKNIHNIRWHFIGHLQSNKVRDLLKTPKLWAIHSVDSVRLVVELLKRENDFKGKELKLFFQVNTSHESEKSGFESIDELQRGIELVLSKKESKFKVYGLMTMGPIRTDNFEESALKSFRTLKSIRNQQEQAFGLKELKLSMGMSQDYQLAIAEGTDYVRVGSLIFK